APLFKEVRELILRKCAPGKEKQIRAIFEKQPFGELERLVTQKLLDVGKSVAKEELKNENWLHLVAGLSDRSYEEMRVIILEFLKKLKFKGKRPNALYYYRELQNLRDPLHFRSS